MIRVWYQLVLLKTGHTFYLQRPEYRGDRWKVSTFGGDWSNFLDAESAKKGLRSSIAQDYLARDYSWEVRKCTVEVVDWPKTALEQLAEQAE